MFWPRCSWSQRLNCRFYISVTLEFKASQDALEPELYRCFTVRHLESVSPRCLLSQSCTAVLTSCLWNLCPKMCSEPELHRCLISATLESVSSKMGLSAENPLL
ncbi:hypothetical protein AVEN_164397-1 [Araneus ventricosus]|uniref:Uncharacterized protein n=1 Tax=Araneus ventricosus TaxID=182803 RepID=A0A4Y2VXD3_ARAVE|nr:hypothetical protein AVEN_164397-1 [Araneus ventricosus]